MILSLSRFRYLFCLVLLLGSVGLLPAAAVKIMPLGDSITHGFTNANSYRRVLWKLLTNSGYSVDFVGSLTTGYDGPVPNPDFDLNHEGHRGYETYQIRDNINAWATANPPDIVLLHIGTNDAKSHTNATTTTNLIAQIIDLLRVVNPNVKILLAQIIPLNGNGTNAFYPPYNLPADWPYVLALNQVIPALVAAKTTGPSPVILVDQFSDFNLLTDLFDGLHPNAVGESKMASKWFDALQGVLTSTGNPPPKIALTLPLHWTNFSPGTNITLSVTASDVNGSVTNVEFFLGTNKFGNVTNAPYQLTWSNATSGLYTISARAFDNGGITRTSFSRTISVNNGSRWSMEEGSGPTAFDTLGLTNRATLRNGVTWTGAGKFGGGVSLNSAALNYLDVPASDDVELAGRNFTVALWVKTSKTGAQTLVEKQGFTDRGIFMLAINRDAVAPGRLSVYNGDHWIDGVTGGLTNGQWHHVAVTYDRTSFRLYLDGALDSTTADYDFLLNTPQKWTFGRFITQNVGWEFNGLMDEVRIVPRTLTGTEITTLLTATNQAPTVSAGTNQTISLPAVANLAGTATDDGLPTNFLARIWSKVSGPGTVAFGNSNAAITTASFSTGGSYVLKLTGTDGQLTNSATVTITVNPANQPPVVSPGTNQTITLPAAANLAGVATDDGLPTNFLATTWSKLSGPGTVNFGNAAATNTTATFSTNGTYVLQFTATDGQLTNTTNVTITVNPVPNQPPVVNAGPNLTIISPTIATLSGSASDDGSPSNVLVVGWSKMSGPGLVTFGNSNAPATTADFSTNGVYLLALTASDGALSTNATVTVTVMPPLRFSGPYRSNGQFGFRLTGPSGTNYLIQYSSTLTNWFPLATNAAPSGLLDVIDSGATGVLRRFYRAQPVP